MKTATIPALRVTPDLRQAAQNVLREGETLSSFVEESLRAQIERRRFQQEFIARGIAAGHQAKASGDYRSKEEVMKSLKGILDRKRRGK